MTGETKGRRIFGKDLGNIELVSLTDELGKGSSEQALSCGKNFTSAA